MEPILFDGWGSVARMALLAGSAYLAMVLALRIFGETALAQMTSYDLIVTVALGSVLATIPMSPDVSLVDGLVVVLALLLLQYVTRWMLRRVPPLRPVIKDKPQLVLWDGRMLETEMRRLNITEDEVRAAVRSAGKASLTEVLALVLENDGKWSVVDYPTEEDRSALAGVLGADSRPTRAPPAGERRRRQRRAPL
ncbi:MAG: DUF421 domain-containing protein [Gemmatimonadota bacterium]|nr:DUF421 domain-containing protein [Gemmatimonadota bacterium]